MEQLIQNSIDAINEYAQEEIPELLAEIQVQRFKNQGEFLDHKKWDPNGSLYIKINNKKRNPEHNSMVSWHKYNRPPLIDTGHLVKEMIDSKNWKKEVKLQKQGLNQKFVIPQTESFSDPKYDKQNEGSAETQTWKSSRTGESVSVGGVPARPFKDTSKTDITWVAQQLSKKLNEKFSNG
jgi:hypothetical protein